MIHFVMAADAKVLRIAANRKRTLHQTPYLVSILAGLRGYRGCRMWKPTSHAVLRIGARLECVRDFTGVVHAATVMLGVPAEHAPLNFRLRRAGLESGLHGRVVSTSLVIERQ